ncbi:uncharacterized protein LOC113342979 [Papaver somniferum]|uniref:uncharacterized protein LOC113342979 n=1 Tax=Papaver somniferum TaxID=3469 RepID=UPI000E70084C|nr:uncharacterized protein LOC113342979 [Papaver somniferum]
MTLFKAVYGYNPLHMEFPTTSVTYVATVETYLKQRDYMMDLLKESLHKAQERMKFFADKNRNHRSFEVGDRVYLNMHPYRKASISLRKNFKLSAKYRGLFPILQKVRSLAYKLELPSSARIHPVFHVSQLKKQIGKAHIPSPAMPIVDHAREIIMFPEKF